MVVRALIEGTIVTEDGSELPLDTAVPLDPGEHVLQLNAPGRPALSRTVTLREGETLAVELSVPPAIVLVPSLSEVASPLPSPLSPQPAKATPVLDEDGGVPVWAWLSGGAGLVLGGVAIGFAVDAVSAADELEEICGGDLVCDEDLSFDPEPLNDRKNRSMALGLGLGAAGAVGLVVAVIGFATSGSDNTAAVAPVAVGGWSTNDAGGITLFGSF